MDFLHLKGTAQWLERETKRAEDGDKKDIKLNFISGGTKSRGRRHSILLGDFKRQKFSVMTAILAFNVNDAFSQSIVI